MDENNQRDVPDATGDSGNVAIHTDSPRSPNQVAQARVRPSLGKRHVRAETLRLWEELRDVVRNEEVWAIIEKHFDDLLRPTI